MFYFNFYVFFLASVNISSGILTTKNINQSLDWTNYHLRCSWSTWSMRGKLLLSCGIVTMKRGILLAHKSVIPVFGKQRPGMRLSLNLNLNLNALWVDHEFYMVVRILKLIHYVTELGNTTVSPRIWAKLVLS